MHPEKKLFETFAVPRKRQRYIELLDTKRGREKIRLSLGSCLRYFESSRASVRLRGGWPIFESEELNERCICHRER